MQRKIQLAEKKIVCERARKSHSTRHLYNSSMICIGRENSVIVIGLVGGGGKSYV